MDDYGFITLLRQRQLRGEYATLHIPWRMVVMIVQPTFTNGNCPARQKVAKGGNICIGMKGCSVVRVNSSCIKNIPGILFRNLTGCFSLLKRSADANDCTGARFLSSLDYRAIVACEGGICEVGVAVNEVLVHVAFARGYLRSIHIRIGPAM